MAETSRARAGFHILLAAIALNVAVAAIYPSVSLAGDPNNFSANEGNDNFGHLSQADVCGIEAIACGPTAAVNGFVYLQNRFPRIYGTKLTPTDSTSEVATALALASPSYMDTHGSGTLINDFILGKEQYISDATKGDIGAATIVDAQVSPVFPGNETAGLPAGDMAEPTGAFLANQLIDKEATEILIFPVNNNDVQSGPGHYLTVVDLH
ncbi:MAG TPA: hypothetical protein VIZ17_09100, partial [Acetobacteraceae bacterium]